MKLPIIINEAGKIYIEAVPRLAWGKGKECTFIGALEAALSVTNTPFTYEDLMGWAGLVFRLRWFLGEAEQHWSPSSPVGEFSEEFDALRRATGFELPMANRLGDVEPHMEEFAARIAAEVRAGRPVLAYDPTLNMATIVGFENNGRIVLMHDYMSDEPVLRIAVEQLGPFICFLGPRGPALAPRDALLEGVRLGVDNWHRGFAPGQNGRYWHGRAGLLKWREDLQHVEDLCFDEKRLLFFVNWWVFDCLVDARTSAEKFLHKNARLLCSSPHRHAFEAASVYTDEARLLRSTIADKEIFLGPWTGKGVEHWTDAVRESEIVFLGRLLSFEADAIGELENLLDASDVPIRSAHLAGA